MTAPLKSIEGEADVARIMREIGARAREAMRTLALAPSAAKDAALTAMAKAIIVRVGSSRVDLQACKLEYSIVSPK